MIKRSDNDMSNMPIKFAYGESSNPLLNGNSIGLNPGTVYFSADGKIIFDAPPATAGLSPRRVLMETADTLEFIPGMANGISMEWQSAELQGYNIHGYNQKNNWGTFAIQIILQLEGVGPACYSGIFSSCMGISSYNSNDEILLHRSGASQDIELYA